MRYQLGLFLAGCLVAISSHAAVPVVLKVTERSFQVEAGSGAERSENPDAATVDNKDPKIPTDLMAQIWVEERPEYVQQSVFKAKQNLFKNRADAMTAKYSKQLADYVEALAVKYNATVKEVDGVKVYAIEDGISFFKDYYKFDGNRDITFQIMAKAMLRNQNRMDAAAPLEKLVVDIHEDVRAKTYLLPVKDYTEADLEALKTLGRGKGYRFERIGETYVFGSGISFLLTRGLMAQGQGEADVKLRKDFSKILRYHEAFQIPVIHGYHQGALAYYNPRDKEMSFVVPTAAELNAYTHEMTHSRFDKFTATLTSWVNAKGYVVPFHIAGPNGGLFNLLNELNSFRMGNQFDRENTSDAEILKIIKDNYGLQAGFEATEMLDKVWTAEKVANKSVAYLIYSEVRNFNKLSNEQVLDMGRSGVANNNMVEKMNFILMFESGRFAGTALENEAREVFTKVGEVANEQYIAEYYEKVAKEKGIIVSEEIMKKTGSVLDLKKASFNQVFKEFNKRASPESVELLTTKFKDQLRPEHMASVVKRAMEPMDRMRPDLYLLGQMIGTNDTGYPVEINGSVSETRAPRTSPMLTAFDDVVSKTLFDGSSSHKRQALLNFIAITTLPEEMPKTFEVLAKNVFTTHAQAAALPAGQSNKAITDLYFARQILSPGDGHVGRSAPWGVAIMKAAVGKNIEPDFLYRAMGFYKESLSPYLSPKYKYGEYAFVNMDAETRGRVLRAITQLSADNKKTLASASTNMWRFAHSQYPKIATEAVFALLSNPMYLLMNEANMVQAIRSGDGQSMPIIEFLVNAAEGMLPKAKEAIIARNQLLMNTKSLSGYRIQLKSEKSIYGQGLFQVGNATRVVMSCNKVLLAK